MVLLDYRRLLYKRIENGTAVTVLLGYRRPLHKRIENGAAVFV